MPTLIGEVELEHPQHVEEPGRAAEVVDERAQRHLMAPAAPRLAARASAGAAGQLGAGRQQRRAAGQAAEEEVAGDVERLPDRRR